jgi:FkbM family methyltransferase
MLVQDITSLSHHVHTDASAAPRQQLTGSFTVELLSLADIMQRLGHAGSGLRGGMEVEVLKMDVEGAEFAVLEALRMLTYADVC